MDRRGVRVVSSAVLLAVCGVGAACAADHPGALGSSWDSRRPRSPASVGTVASSLDDGDQACPPLRYVGYAAPSSCKTVATPNGAYVASSLFPPATDAKDPRGAAVLQGYCALVWTPTVPGTDVPPAADIAKLEATADALFSKDYHRDCQVVAPLADRVLSDDPRLWRPLLSSLHDATDWLDTLPSAADASVPSVEQVRVAVVDSSPTGYYGGRAGAGRYGHGRGIGRVVRDLSCPTDSDATPAPCIGHVDNQLALSLVDPYTIDRKYGGYFGTQGELALAIEEAVHEWDAFNRTATVRQPRLVINLSVGWDSDHAYGGEPVTTPVSSLDTQVRAVRDAIAHAVCRGALVVAAAGNTSAGKKPSTGPMFPAAWELAAAPSGKDCVKLEGGGFDATSGPYPAIRSTEPARSLVYSVSGVDGLDAPLATTRRGGRPRLAAYGYMVTETDDASAHTNIMTGTSIATAVVSGVAAARWAYQPALTPYELMERVYASSIDLATPADYCFGDTACASTIKRVSVCRAVNRCDTEAAPCDACAGAAAFAGSNPTWDASWATFDPTPSPRPAVISCGTSGTSCAPPDRSYENKVSRPWVRPQPGQGGCEACSLEMDPIPFSLDVSLNAPSSPTGTFFLSLDPAVDERDVVSIVLSVDTLPGARVNYPIPVPSRGARVISVPGIGGDVGGLAGNPNPTVSFLFGALGGSRVATSEQVNWH